jgi:hypothetical protein
MFWRPSYPKLKHSELSSTSMSLVNQHHMLVTDRTLSISQSEVAVLVLALRISSYVTEPSPTILYHLTGSDYSVSSENTFLPGYDLYVFNPAPTYLLQIPPVSTIGSFLIVFVPWFKYHKLTVV